MKNLNYKGIILGVFFSLLISTQETKSQEPENINSINNKSTLTKFSEVVPQTKSVINLETIKKNLDYGRYISRGRFWGWALIFFGSGIAHEDYLTTQSNKYLGNALFATGSTMVFLTPRRMPQKVFLGLVIACNIANSLHIHWEKQDIEKQPTTWTIKQLVKIITE